MRASLLCVSLVIAQVTSLEPRRWCTRCHVHSTAATVPVLGQTTHHWVDRHDWAAVCIRSQPQRLVGAAPRLKLHMKLGAQVQVQTALRQTQQSIFAAAVARARACYASSLRALSFFWWPRLSAIADKFVVFQEHNGCVEYGHIRRCNNHSRHFLGEHFHSGCCSEARPPKANLQLASHMVDHVVIDRSVAKCVPSFVLVRDQTAHYTGRASQI